MTETKDVKKPEWFYTEAVKQHFFDPKNILKNDEEVSKYKFDGVGQVGSPACGDVMKMWIRVDKKTDTIIDCKWQTFGCASAIASTSMLSTMVIGLKIDDALKITPKDIMEKLGGLPAIKVHCSVLGDKALKAAVEDYFRRSGQENRIKK